MIEDVVKLWRRKNYDRNHISSCGGRLCQMVRFPIPTMIKAYCLEERVNMVL